jgi:hypothetical protein
MKPHQLLQDPHDGKYGQLYLPWGETAERLCYREGEPWCYGGKDHIVCGNETERKILSGWVFSLHRLAAILCDDAQAFMVLHQCIQEYGNG